MNCFYLEMNYNTAVADVSAVIRRAKVEDFQDLLKFGDLYSGTDLVRHYFYQWVFDETYHPLLLKVDGEKAGFNLCQIIDGGQAVIYRAIRIAEKFRQRGYMKLLASFTEKYIKEQLPTVKYIKSVMRDENFSKLGSICLRDGHVVKSQKQMFTVLFDCLNMRNLNLSHQVLSLSSKHLEKLFSCNGLMQQFFPENFYFVNYIPFKVMEANISYITGNEIFVFASLSELRKHNSKTSKVVLEWEDNIDEIDIISIAEAFTSEIGLCYCIEVAATKEVSASSLENIVSRNLQEIFRLTEGRGAIFFTFNQNITLDEMMRCLKTHGVTEFMPGLECVNYRLMEKNISLQSVI